MTLGGKYLVTKDAASRVVLEEKCWKIFQTLVITFSEKKKTALVWKKKITE